MDALGTARIIVEGKVQSAQRRDDGTIEFTLAVARVLRGEAVDTLSLVAMAPEDCGAPVRLAYGDTYFLREPQATLTTCDSLRLIQEQEGGRAYRLNEALDLVTSRKPFPGDELKQRVERTLRSLDPAELREFFDIVDRLDPAYGVRAGADGAFSYRDLRVRLSPEGTYLALEEVSE